MASGSTNDITFIVPGQAQDAAPATTRGAAKATVRVGTERGGGVKNERRRHAARSPARAASRVRSLSPRSSAGPASKQKRRVERRAAGSGRRC